MTGSGGHKKGRLSTLRCPVMLGPGSELIPAYTVSILDEGVTHDRDSGSWVVNERTLKVIGHIVATDELGDAYVIPFSDVFEDIRLRLAARSVELASASQIRSTVQVPDSLNRIGFPHLDAIRGNGAYCPPSPSRSMDWPDFLKEYDQDLDIAGSFDANTAERSLMLAPWNVHMDPVYSSTAHTQGPIDMDSAYGSRDS
ncbi:hypothetical protein N658DRAFT_252358 [Parathielavia hyrcaniae]|uniref:Uncharacterized protein n=1 Tax=Parathielavia hyrcaniae TaxID=113614 RepID=A0AAN6PU83_9PEZI|nr:hypothetical protein N658DRAFT_252358 [Parathielavia hyrcaniae]